MLCFVDMVVFAYCLVDVSGYLIARLHAYDCCCDYLLLYEISNSIPSVYLVRIVPVVVVFVDCYVVLYAVYEVGAV